METEARVQNTRPGEGNLSVQSAPADHEVISAFLAGIDVKPSSKKGYGKAMRLYLQWVSDTGRVLKDITQEDIIAYKEDLLSREPQLSSLSVAFYLSSVRRFYTWSESRKLYPNVAAGVRPPKIRKDFVKQHLTPSECDELLGKLSDDVDMKIRKKSYPNGHSEGLRDLALINLLLRTGMRTVEASRANVGDITSKRGKSVILVQGKGRSSKDEFIPLSGKARSALDDYLVTRPAATASEPLFICEGFGSRGRRLSERRIQEIAKEALRSVGIDGHEYSAHSLRHTCAVLLLNAGVDPYDVQKYMRHRSIDTTEIYLESIEEERRLERSAEQFIDNTI
ncbi:MAG: tyrosine-type recombinase/integrase [Candidatus Methanomethylophilaceae archaeon]|nr:tyrosine-type recombinase/integrase [Candidatus Methanomethylophilaceae archaeon]